MGRRRGSDARSCGEWGCWPLLARIVETNASVTWTDFEQPFRPARDDSTFGPFAFERVAYDTALAALQAVIG